MRLFSIYILNVSKIRRRRGHTYIVQFENRPKSQHKTNIYNAWENCRRRKKTPLDKRRISYVSYCQRNNFHSTRAIFTAFPAGLSLNLFARA